MHPFSVSRAPFFYFYAQKRCLFQPAVGLLQGAGTALPLVREEAQRAFLAVSVARCGLVSVVLAVEPGGITSPNTNGGGASLTGAQARCRQNSTCLWILLVKL